MDAGLQVQKQSSGEAHLTKFAFMHLNPMAEIYTGMNCSLTMVSKDYCNVLLERKEAEQILSS